MSNISFLVRLFGVSVFSPSKTSSSKSTFASRDLNWFFAMTKTQMKIYYIHCISVHSVNILFNLMVSSNNSNTYYCLELDWCQTITYHLASLQPARLIGLMRLLARGDIMMMMMSPPDSVNSSQSRTLEKFAIPANDDRGNNLTALLCTIVKISQTLRWSRLP